MHYFIAGILVGYLLSLCVYDAKKVSRSRSSVASDRGKAEIKLPMISQSPHYPIVPGGNSHKNMMKYNAIPKNTSHCSAVKIHPKPKPITKDNKYGLWPGLMSQNDLASGSVLYGFEEAMDIIWKTQNPPDCRKAKYYIVEGFMQGFGSEFHIYGVALAIAVDHGRVLLIKECYYHPWSKCTLNDAYHAQYADNTEKLDLLAKPILSTTTATSDGWNHQLDGSLWFTVLKYGSKGAWSQIAADIPGKTPLQCYLRWKTHVKQKAMKGRRTIDAAVEKVTTKEEQDIIDFVYRGQIHSFYRAIDGAINMTTFHIHLPPWPERIQSRVYADRMIVLSHELIFQVRPFVPHIFHQYLDCTPLPRFWYFLWWRGIAITYFLRPNEKTLAWLEANRDQSLLKKYDGKCIATYVRHGDKSVEMILLPFQAYAYTAMTVWNASRSTEGKHKVTSAKVFYVSSEDRNVFQEAKQFGKILKADIRYSNISQMLVANNPVGLKHYTLEHSEHPSLQTARQYEYLSYLLHLTDILSCEVVICTWPSNYCRVIDELRTTIGGKANRLSIDIGVETCAKSPKPCQYSHGLGNHVETDIYDPHDCLW